MPSTATKAAKKRVSSKKGIIQRVENAAPCGDALVRLVKKHPAPQKWYDEEVPVILPKRRS